MVWRAVAGLEGRGEGQESRNAGGLWNLEMTSAGSQQGQGDLNPVTARDCVLTATCLSRRTDCPLELPEGAQPDDT